MFGILGIFSARYRNIARQAFDCVFKRITLRKCETGFDRKMKAKISNKLLEKNKKLGSFVFKHFESLSWIFTIAMLISFIFTAIAIYNLVVFGTCDPATGQCIITNNQAIIQKNCNQTSCVSADCNCTTAGSQGCSNQTGCGIDCNGNELPYSKTNE